jgi:hypothetical protein
MRDVPSSIQSARVVSVAHGVSPGKARLGSVAGGMRTCQVSMYRHFGPNAEVPAMAR